MKIKTTDLCDQFSDQIHVCEDIFQSFGKRKNFYGPIHTVKVFEDNVLVKQALETIPSGSVLVVDGGGSKQCALLGDRLAGIAAERGLAGIIIYGCVRDTADLAKLDIGVLAIGKNPRKSRKEGKGEAGIPVSFAGIQWEPGHYVYADEDGVVVSKTKLSSHGNHSRKT
ncbi:ribonuclease E activity regulator RraA [Lihuaxuella thermophila]|uniref:4-hydroxy-4-methyl-2-oxoglutarate aldolase n=1 Tax=Lihuaxuella thermophila TaxID=1173111 RepID=A0A1H8G3Z9_9BACL|nr:ribonuclease E activity regulator RraA [Lihuaxuella thermophila]SEN38485.1 regulator of ribonuclease activity A [Lihuaxuella thermophila]